MFAIVPPPGMCGGVPCFVGALFMIGVQVTLACPNPKTNPNPNPNQVGILIGREGINRKRCAAALTSLVPNPKPNTLTP